MKTNLENRTKKEKGQSLLEFAISLTVIMTLLAGAVEFGIALFQYVQLRDAAQEGALYGSLNPDDLAGIEARVKAASSSPIDLQNDGRVGITIDIIENSDVEAESCEGDGMQVTIAYPHDIFMPFLSAILGTDTIQINASVTDTILISGAGCP